MITIIILIQLTALRFLLGNELNRVYKSLLFEITQFCFFQILLKHFSF